MTFETFPGFDSVETIPEPLKMAALEVLTDLDSPMAKEDLSLQNFPNPSVPVANAFPDSMMIMSALLSMEEKLGGSLENLDASTAPPVTFGDFLELSLSLHPEMMQAYKKEFVDANK